MERTSAQQGIRRHDARVHPPFVSPAKAGAQEPRWCRCHGADLNAAGLPPAGCLSSLERTAPSVLRKPWWPDVLLAATQSSVVPGSRRSPGKRGVEKREAQEPRWCRGHGTDLSAADIPPAGCLGAHEKTAPSVLRKSWWFDVLLAATQCSMVPGSRRSPGKRGVEKREAQQPSWCRGHGADLSAAGVPPARCPSGCQKQAPPCCGSRGGPMSFWLPPDAP